MFSSPTHHKRRPTISRKRKTSDVEDRVDSAAEETKKKGASSVVISDSGKKNIREGGREGGRERGR